MTSSTRQQPAAAGGAPADFEGPKLTHKQILTILSGLVLGMFLAALDQTIVSTSIVRIANDLNGFDLQAWATTAYLITATIATPLYGKLSDIYGRKPFFLTAISIFVVGSAACTFANSMYMLAAFRAFQGLGAGGLMSLALTIIGDIVPPRERSRYQGYFMAVFGTSTVLGPVLGGLLSGQDMIAGIAGWRWVFLINVPIGIIALFVVAKVLNVPHVPRKSKVDWFGGIALAVAVVPLLIVAEQGRTWGWGSTGAVLCYAVAAFGVVLFLFVEYVMKDAALIPLRLFKNGTFAVAILGGVIVGVAMFGGLSMIPQYYQVVGGYTPTESGLLMLPLVLGIMSGSLISGQVTARTGRYKFLPVVGTLLITAGMVLFATLIKYDSPLWQPMVFSLVIGLGLGGCMQTLIIAVQNAGPRRDMGVSTAAATFFRQIGGTLGVAVFLTILFNALPGKLTDAFGGKLPASFSGAGDLATNTSGIQSLPDALRIPVLTAFTNSMIVVFWVAAGVAALAFLVLLFMKEIPLKGSGSAQETAPTEGADASPQVTQNSAALAAEAAEKEDWAEIDAQLDDREPELVTAGKHARPGENGHGVFEPAAQTTPFATATAGMSSPVDTDGQPITGHIRRQDGSSVLGAALTLIDQRGRQVARANAGSDGGYTIGTPGPGTYVLIVSAGGHQPQASSVVVGQGPARLDLTLVGSGELSGFVRVAGSGTPLSGATVTLTDSRGEVTGASITTAEGAYTFNGVGAGTYTLVASAERMRPVATLLTVPDSGVLRHDVELTSAVVLAGTARTDGDRAVPDARITVLDVEGNVAAVARTDSEGRYLVSDLPEGDYTVVASGYPPATSQVNLLGGGEITHDVSLGYEQVIDQFAGHGDTETEQA
ncbi:MFS transporter [Amycolatopsis acidicola]|uniref:MFS transporter n=1 Tax=Amycolatopsis acidicola TaxID=2596893 RepID=A0A5N0V3N0_9PSEU|nr:MFS transporter [Amycolatopsis acidicola]KAA9161039.1 MFS transporter [Amycolatopsis acidicola]